MLWMLLLIMPSALTSFVNHYQSNLILNAKYLAQTADGGLVLGANI